MVIERSTSLKQQKRGELWQGQLFNRGVIGVVERKDRNTVQNSFRQVDLINEDQEQGTIAFHDLNLS